MRFKVSFEFVEDIDGQVEELKIRREFIDTRKETLKENIKTWIKSEIKEVLSKNKYEFIENFKIEVEE